MNVVRSGMPSDKPVVNFIAEPEFIQKLDDFQFAHRFKTRAAAIKWLVSAALDAGLTPGPDELRFTPKVRAGATSAEGGTDDRQ
jgi:hypothetical protein